MLKHRAVFNNKELASMNRVKEAGADEATERPL
jgi:hypothetical protein